MYESFFLLSQRPFIPTPHAEAYIPTGSLDAARQTLMRCLERGAGPGLVIGPAGTGKSLLCQILAKHFRGRFQVALLSAARLCTRRALLQSILFELKLPYREMDEGELRLSLIDHLEPRSSGPEGLLLLVDEAHTLPLRLLEEVRLLTNLARDGQSRVRLVLAGGMALEERLASPKLESFQQRIAARCYLQPLGRDETIYYVQEQIRRAGGAADSLLTGEAQAAIHTASDGIPRLINQLCDHALLLAALGGVRQIDEAGIEEAWADLQQLPVPLAEPPVLAGAGLGKAGSIVEFGQLGEEEPGARGQEPGAKSQGPGTQGVPGGQGTAAGRVVAGTIGPSVAEAAAGKLDEISYRIEMLRADDPAEIAKGGAADDFSPVAANGTEVELIFHSAHDPFGGNWEEEEVVIDRYASLEDAAVRKVQRVTSDHGREFGAAIAAAIAPAAQIENALEEPAVTPAARPRDDDADEETPLSIAATIDFHPASDPLLPEAPVVPVPARRAAVALGELGQDDRDLIVVDEEEPTRPLPLTGRPRRQEYRKLFSTLRNK